MKASLLTAIRRFEVRHVPDPPPPGDHDVLVRIGAVGVCGSDLHYYLTGRIGPQVVGFPFILGHEAAGTVEQVGRAVRTVAPGTRVAIDPALSCGECDQCTAGREHTCRRLRFLGSPGQHDGCLQEYIVIPGEACHPIPGSMTLEQGVLAEPLAIAVYAVERARPVPGAVCAILGAGPIGMSVFHVLKTMQPGNVHVSEKIDDRLRAAGLLRPAWLGNPDKVDLVKTMASLEPPGVDIVFECTGDVHAIIQGIQILKPGGLLVVVGIPEVDDITLPIHELRRKEITILNIRRQNHCTQKAIDMLATRAVNLDALVTHHYSLQETQKAFDQVASHADGVMKAIISLRP